MNPIDLVIEEAIVSLKQVKNDISATTEVLKIIDFCFHEDAIVNRALETIDAGNVLKVIGEPSGRYLHQVHSSGAKKALSSGIEVDPGLSSGLFYTVISGRCTCYDYAKRVEANYTKSHHTSGVERTDTLQPSVKRPRIYCKHSLAVSIAENLGRSKVATVSDLELYKLLLG